MKGEAVEQGKEARLKELTEAREAVAHQIEALRTNPPYYSMNRDVQLGPLLKKLRTTLSELEECISAELRSE